MVIAFDYARLTHVTKIIYQKLSQVYQQSYYYIFRPIFLIIQLNLCNDQTLYQSITNRCTLRIFYKIQKIPTLFLTFPTPFFKSLFPKQQLRYVSTLTFVILKLFPWLLRLCSSRAVFHQSLVVLCTWSFSWSNGCRSSTASQSRERKVSVTAESWKLLTQNGCIELVKDQKVSKSP